MGPVYKKFQVVYFLDWDRFLKKLLGNWTAFQKTPLNLALYLEALK